MEDSFYKYQPPWVNTRINNQIDWTVYDNIPISPEPPNEEPEEKKDIIPPHAFQLVQVTIEDLCVRQGTIRGAIPTISGTPLAADVKDNSLSLPATGTREYWLKITLDSNRYVTNVSIENSEPSDDSATQAKLLLGSVETNSGNIVAFNSNLSGSQSLASCGATHYFGVV